MATYIATDPASYMGQVVGSGQCVAFVQVSSGAPETSKWTKGKKVKGATLDPGIAIATLTANGYPNQSSGNHAAIYIAQTAAGIQVWDQWVGQPVHKRTIRFHGGTNPDSNDGDTFYVIESDMDAISTRLDDDLDSYLSLDLGQIIDYLRQCVVAGIQYKLNGKVPRHGADPNTYKALDCSGFTSECLYRASEGRIIQDGGSVLQHDWVKSTGAPKASIADGALMDNALRIAFLPPSSSRTIGHVAFIHMGQTIECYGGHGPGRREWTGAGWQASTAIYVLTAPELE